MRGKLTACGEKDGRSGRVDGVDGDMESAGIDGGSGDVVGHCMKIDGEEEKGRVPARHNYTPPR